MKIKMINIFNYKNHIAGNSRWLCIILTQEDIDFQK